MSILSSLLGSYADDLTKAAAKTATKSAAKTASKALVSQADDIAMSGIKSALKTASTGQSDDILKAAGKSVAGTIDDIKSPLAKATKLDVSAPSAFQRSMGGSLSDLLSGEDADTIMDLIETGGGLSKKSMDNLRKNVKGYLDETASLKTATGFNKSELPKIRTSDYVKATGLSGKDIPSYMRQHLSKDGLSLMDNAWGDYLPQLTDGVQFNGTADDILEMYERASNAADANAKVLTGENLRGYLSTHPEVAPEYEKEIARNLGLDKAIDVDKVYKRASVPVKVGKVEETAPEALKQATSDISPKTKATKATAEQKLASKERLQYAADMGASTKQREELFRSYRLGGKNTTIGDYLKNQNVTLANVRDRSDAALNAFGSVKDGLLEMADDAGIMIDMPSLVGAKSSALKKADLNMIKNTLGIDLENDILTKAMKPSEAEALYTELRNRAFNYQKSDATKAAGKALQDAVADLGNAIDDSLNSIKGTYGLTQKVADAAGEAGLGYNEIRNIIDKGDNLTVRDLRTLQQPWVVARDMVANKAPKAATLNIAGIDTGLPNVVKNTVEGAGNLPLKAAAYLEQHPNMATAGLVGAGVAGGSILGSLLSGGGQGQAVGGYGANMGYDTTGATGASSLSNLLSGTTAASEPTINGWTYDDLETAYFNAMMAGDSDAAKAAASMMDVLQSKAERLKESSESSGVAAKQRSAINVLNNLMGNFRAKGTVSGNLGQFLNMITGGGYDPQQYAYDTGSKGALGSIIKALGDTGALSEGDQQRALQLLPSTTDSAQAAQMKYQQLLQILQSAGTK